MSELLTTEAMEISARLAREAGLLAGRLARFLDVSLRGAEAAVADSNQFLWALFEAAAEGRPPEAWPRDPRTRAPADAPHRVDELVPRDRPHPRAEGFGLDPGVAFKVNGDQRLLHNILDVDLRI